MPYLQCPRYASPTLGSTSMKPDEVPEKIDWLVSGWCARKELSPLRHILNGMAAINGLKDGWHELLENLKAIRAQDRNRLTEEELNVVIELQHEIDRRLC